MNKLKTPKTNGLEWHHFGERLLDVHNTNHLSGKLRCKFPHQRNKFSEINPKLSKLNGNNNMWAEKNNHKWIILYIPTQVLLCDKCGIKFSLKTALNRHRTYQHASCKLICPECNYTWSCITRNFKCRTFDLT